MTIDKLNDYALKIFLDKNDLEKFEINFSDIDSSFVKNLILMLSEEISQTLNINPEKEKFFVEVFARKSGCLIFISCSGKSFKQNSDEKFFICQSEDYDCLKSLCHGLNDLFIKKIKFSKLYANNHHMRLIVGVTSNYYTFSGIAENYGKVLPGNEINMGATEEYFSCIEPSDAIQKILKS